MTSEHTEQAAVFEWAALMQGQYPELQLLFAIPNAGKRSYGAAAYYKAEGLRSGIPDICLPFPSGYWQLPNGAIPYHALFIEMKSKNGKITPEQKKWQWELECAGNRVRVCYSADEAIKVICDYLGIEG